MNAIQLSELKPKTYFTSNLFLDSGFVLLAPECPVTEELVKRLSAWEFRMLRTEGEVRNSILQPESSSEAADVDEIPVLSDGAGEREHLDAISGTLVKYGEFVEKLFTRFVTSNELDYKELMDRVKIICGLATEHRRFVLRALAQAPIGKNYLVSHAVHSSILSIILGAALKLPIFRLIELGGAAVLHEIGMVRLPPQLYMAGRQLSPLEKKSITAHPILGYNLLKEKQVPLAVCLGALEHHERMNGTGYPRGLTGEKISLYARVIAVACSYDAVTAARPYKEAKEGYAGMVDILKNEGKQYDEAVIKALVYSLSIFPIGSYVLLSNGRPAVVVDVNPDNPRFPVVQILGVSTPDGKELIVKTTESGLKIARPLTHAEAESMEKAGVAQG